ncbi:MAG TPA: hypothetical protein PKB10_06495, partial [Tepidisphaeraceae bacterium]|nr:hypothetical protein [Tepidisphaeraceae bacterium]
TTQPVPLTPLTIAQLASLLRTEQGVTIDETRWLRVGPLRRYADKRPVIVGTQSVRGQRCYIDSTLAAYWVDDTSPILSPLPTTQE